MIIKQYKINPDGTYGGMEEAISDVDIDISMYSAPCGYTFKEPADETYVWDGENWVEPYQPTLDELKAAKIAEIGAAFDTYVSGRTPVSLGWDMQFNLRDIQMVDGAVRIMETTGDTEGYLTDADNVNHYGLTIDQMKQVLLEMGTAFLMAHAKKQQLRDAVGAATTAEQLDAIVW